MAAVTIGSGETFEPTSAQTLYVLRDVRKGVNVFASGVFVAICVAHIFICCLGTDVLARLQGAYVVLNLL